MDGRIQESIIKYLRERFGVEYVDTITEPGPCGILASQQPKELVSSIRRRLDISINKHGSRLICISGHADCAGNPVGDAIQKSQVRESTGILQKQYPGCEIIGLWLDLRGNIEIM
jgi:hypothetical protein